MKSLHFIGSLLKLNLRAAYANRGSFWMQTVLMMANNLIFFAVWPIFFRKFETLAGWQLGDVAAMYGIVAAAFGIVVVFAGGHRTLAQTIAEGDLDPYLTMPKPVLPHLVGSRCMPSGFGDILTGVLMLALSGRVSFGTLPLTIVSHLLCRSCLPRQQHRHPLRRILAWQRPDDGPDVCGLSDHGQHVPAIHLQRRH